VKLMESRSSSLTIVHCNATLEVAHAHFVRAAHRHDSGDWILIHPEWISKLTVRPDMWSKVLEVLDTRPEYGNINRRMRANLARFEAEIPFASYQRIELVVSDLFWLMNNVLVAKLAALCSSRGSEFSLTIMDEGSVLYSTRLGLRRILRSFAKYAYITLHGFPALFVHSANVNYLHPLCKRVLCLHPELLNAPPGLSVEAIRPELLKEVYGDSLPALELPRHSCLYLSQPLYKLVGEERQLKVVRAFKRNLEEQGIRHFFYKPHHADLPSWCDILERECGLVPLQFREMVAFELLAPRCSAEVVVSHTTSALLNLRAYGYHGRVIACGIDELSGAFAERSQYDDFCRCLRTLGSVEWMDTGRHRPSAGVGATDPPRALARKETT